MTNAPLAPDSDPSTAPPASPSAEAATTPRVWPTWALPTITGAAGLLLGLLIGGFGLGAVQAAEQAKAADEVAQAEAEASDKLKSIFSSAAKACSADYRYAAVSDDGMTLTVDHKGKDDLTGISSTEMWCIVDTLKAPSAVTSHMEQTTSMDGRQSESWGNIEVSWSYHPDRGMDSVFTIVE